MWDNLAVYSVETRALTHAQPISISWTQFVFIYIALCVKCTETHEQKPKEKETNKTYIYHIDEENRSCSLKEQQNKTAHNNNANEATTQE